MRIPSGVTDQVIYFVAVDSTDLKTRETGLTTFTVYRDRNGAGAAAMTTPTVTEVDASNMPGVYTLLLDEDMTIGAGNATEEMIFHITQASMAPTDRTIELYVPPVTAGETIAVSSGDVDKVTLVATTTTNTDMVGTDGANTTTPPTAVQNRQEMDLNSTKLAAIPTTAMRGTDIGNLNNLATSDLDAALTSYDGPTNTEMLAAHSTTDALIAGLGGGPGADSVTITITRGGNPVADADVWVTSDAAGDVVVAGTLQTNSAGKVVFLLDDGVTYYLWMQKDGEKSIRGEAFAASAD